MDMEQGAYSFTVVLHYERECHVAFILHAIKSDGELPSQEPIGAAKW